MDTLVKESKVNSNTKTKKSFHELGYSKEGTEKMVVVMNKLLADFHLYYQNLRNFHWNVTGEDFFDLHDQFEELYGHGQTAIDNVAERIRVFGHTPMSNLSEYLENSDIKEAPKNLRADEMVNTILSNIRLLLEKMFDVLDQSITNGDSATEDMMKKYIKYLEKKHWMLSAFLEKN